MPMYTYQHSIFFQYVFGSCSLLIWLFIMNLSELSYNKARCFTVFSLIACAVMFASTMSGLANNFYISDKETKAAVIEYLEQFPDNENESITANTFFISALYKQKELYTINDRNEPTNESAPLADIVLLDKNNAKFDVNYKYFISLGMKETKIDNELVAKRVVRLEIKN